MTNSNIQTALDSVEVNHVKFPRVPTALDFEAKAKLDTSRVISLLTKAHKSKPLSPLDKHIIREQAKSIVNKIHN